MNKRTFFRLAALLFFAAAPASLRASSGDDAYHLYLKGLLNERFGNPEDALPDYEEAARLDPEAPFVHETLAFLALRLNRLDRAALEAAQVVKLRPREPHSYLVLGRVRLALGDAEGAEGAFDQALALEPDNDEALLYAAHLRMLKDPREALSFYERFLQENPDSLEARARMAEIHQRLGEMGAAEEEWKAILKADPSDFPANLALAHIYEVRHDTAAATAAYEACRFSDPENVGILMRLGELYFRGGNSAGAREVFEQALEFAPGDLSASFWLALLAEERGDWDEAVRRMDFVSRESRDPGVLLRLAYFESQAGRGRRALKALKRLHKRDPGNSDFTYYVALGYEDIHAPRSAVRWLEKAVKQDPMRADVYFHLGTNWDQLKNFDRAEAYLLKAVELEPGDAMALNYLGYSWAERGRNLDRAAEFIGKALELDPGNPSFLDSLGWVYFKQGRLGEAEEVLARAALEMEDPVIWEHYGDALDALGRKEEALEAWRRGLDLDPSRPGLLKRLGGGDRKSRAALQAAPRVLLKRVEGNFRQLESLAGSMRLGGQEEGRSVHLQGLFYYLRPGLFRLEIMGPFFAPQALLVNNADGFHWYPPEVGAGLAPGRESWLRVLGDFFSGELARRFDAPDVRVEREGGQVVYKAPFGELRIDAEKKVTASLEWRVGGASLLFRFAEYRQVDGLWLPSRVVCEDPGSRMRISLDLSRVKVNAPLDEDLFLTPAP